MFEMFSSAQDVAAAGTAAVSLCFAIYFGYINYLKDQRTQSVNEQLSKSIASVGDALTNLSDNVVALQTSFVRMDTRTEEAIRRQDEIVHTLNDANKSLAALNARLGK